MCSRVSPRSRSTTGWWWSRARRGDRKGAVESSVRYVCGRWWRTMTATAPEQAQASLDAFCAGPADARRRTTEGTRTTVGALAGAEPLLSLPAVPYPATVIVPRTVAANAAVAFRGNFYSVPPGLAGTAVECRHRLGTATLQVHSAAGTALASHRLEPDGAGALVRDPGHAASLEAAVLAAFTTSPPCQRKGNHPPGQTARAEAARLLASLGGGEVTVDLHRYAELAEAVSR